MIIDAIVSAIGFLTPVVSDFIKKKFLKNESPEATISSLALTKPECLDKFVTARTAYLNSEVKYFNEDVVGNPSKWVVDLRAAIRPLFVIISLLYIGLICKYGWTVDPSFRMVMDYSINSWFGHRLIK